MLSSNLGAIKCEFCQKQRAGILHYLRRRRRLLLDPVWIREQRGFKEHHERLRQAFITKAHVMAPLSEMELVFMVGLWSH